MLHRVGGAGAVRSCQGHQLTGATTQLQACQAIALYWSIWKRRGEAVKDNLEDYLEWWCLEHGKF